MSGRSDGAKIIAVSIYFPTRATDKHCVYCGVELKKSPRRDSPTIEHFNNDGPFDKLFNIDMCCWGCNSSKGVKNLLEWLDSPYFKRKGISQRTVAEVVREYLRTAATLAISKNSELVV